MANSNSTGIWAGLRWPVKALIIAAPIVALIWGAAKFDMIPGLKSDTSKDIVKFGAANEGINSSMSASEIPVLDINDIEFSETVTAQPEMRLMEWIWFGNAGIFSANGGLKTAKNSLMEMNNVNLKLIVNNSVADMKSNQLAFIQEYAKGNKNPSAGVHFVTIMGDGAPAYISAMNEQIEKSIGKEYCLKIIGNSGFSMGEDCLMGPEKWKNDPQTMKGSVISAVIGDGDWALTVRYAADNGIKVNPDPNAYDPEAINFTPAPDDDFLKAAEDAIARKKVDLKEKDTKGNYTGKSISKEIEGAATWFPGDLQIAKKMNMVRVISTAQYPNQMPTVIVGCDKWMKENSGLVKKFLEAALTASNQIKQYDSWFKFATQLAPKVFCTSTGDCSETADDWYKYAKPNGASFNNAGGTATMIGGTQMANLADNQKYYGLKGGNNFYKSVYDYFSNVIKTLNPAGFMDNVKKLTSYEDAVDLSYLANLNAYEGKTETVDYSKNTGEVFAKKSFNIQFRTGSDEILPEGKAQLEELFTSLNIAEKARVSIYGHTDNVGDADKNIALSLKRAKAVKNWLMTRSNNTFPSERFNVDGYGDTKPVGDNATADGKAKNRRVEISLMQ